MAELTIDQIIKIVLAVLVLVLVLTGIYMAFSNYIIPYFSDLGPSQEPDISTPYYQDLIKDDNLIAKTSVDKDVNFIDVRQGNDFARTDYYFLRKTGKIYKNLDGGWLKPWEWAIDPQVGDILNSKIRIFSEGTYSTDSNLLTIQGADKVGVGIYSKK